MATQTAATLIRDARTAAGLTQAELAGRAGITQSVISAYEHGRREPSFATLQRLIAAAGYILHASLDRAEPGGLLAAVRASASELRDALGPLGAVDIRVFGSVARGDESSDSDIDLLVELAPDVGAFALLRMQSAAEAILRRPVDIVPSAGLKPDVADRVAREAVPL
jgi:predicted nucleotidyltransferase/DNA-binding XRE family transcriptional regulator